MRGSVIVIVSTILLATSSPAWAECAWVLWGQDESFWSYKVLNLLLPTRGDVYIVNEYKSLSDCFESQVKRGQSQVEYWNLPEVKKDAEAFGGLRRISYWACVPLPLKPRRIDFAAWK
jgi:hypothetical protein